MMYKQGLVCCVVSGDILRESSIDGESVVRIPFQSDYHLQFKNLHTQRAVVNIYVDGKPVLDNDAQLVIRAGETATVEGFMGKDNVVRNKFRFIQMTDKIAEHRGVKMEDGLIRVVYQFEKPTVVTTPVYTPVPYYRPIPYYEPLDWYPFYPTRPYITFLTGPTGQTRSCNGINGSSSETTDVKGTSESNNVMRPMCAFNVTSKESISDEGITVAGEQTFQKFGSTYVTELETEKHVIIFRLKGKTDNEKPVKTAIGVRTKITCSVCGTKNKSSNKFCRECGAAVIS